ncbi:MAG: RluA family pseudouridine synthase [Lachnospiraceae bacterium]|nr:RluA family pseudouridine synthase [Lachnospiraceae bacterium]
MSDLRSLTVPALEAPTRLDKYLAAAWPDISRSRLQTLAEEGRLCVNGKQPKVSLKLKGGEVITLEVPEPEPCDIRPVDMPLDIIYEDDDILIINKPKDMVVHPSAGHTDDTLVNAILYHCGDQLSGINGIMRPGIVHRIDKDTTGSLIICKNDKAHQFLADKLKVHDIERVYRGIVIGHLKEESGTVDKPLGRDKKDRKKQAVDPNGRHAVTHYRVLQRLNGYDDCEFRLETGRTHQIRVHMASLGHPLLGDPLYGPKKCPYPLTGQTLHAAVIGFEHPTTHEAVRFEAELPAYYKALLKKLGGV